MHLKYFIQCYPTFYSGHCYLPVTLCMPPVLWSWARYLLWRQTGGGGGGDSNIKKGGNASRKFWNWPLRPKSEIYTTKRDDEHPHLFYIRGSPPTPRGRQTRDGCKENEKLSEPGQWLLWPLGFDHKMIYCNNLLFFLFSGSLHLYLLEGPPSWTIFCGTVKWRLHSFVLNKKTLQVEQIQKMWRS